jgi:MtN3 and saliva related transmembrane protein
MTIISFIGLLAAVCATACQIPQVVKTVRTKQTKDISLLMYAVMLVGLACWLAYGLALHDIPLIAANAVTFVLASVVFAYKLRFK